MNHSSVKQRICITTLEFPPDVGGVGQSVHRISHMLRELGYEVHVVVFHSQHRKIVSKNYVRTGYRTVEQDGILVHRIRSAARSQEEAAIQDFYSEVYTQIRALHCAYQFELFHAFFLNETGFITTLIARELDIPVINSIRGSDLHKHIFNPKQHAQIAWTLEQSNWVTFVSGDLLHRANVLVPGIAKRSTAFWNSIVPIDFESLSLPQLEKPLEGLVIGSVGRFRDKKGIDYLIDACDRLQGEFPFTLLLVGNFVEKEKDYWQQVVRDSAIANQIVITGLLPREEAIAYLPLMDIFTIPSTSDGCPNALLEAMMAGRAVIGTDVDAIGEILNNGENSLVVNPGSAAELAEAIRMLAKSPSLRQTLGQRAREKVLTQLAPSVEQMNWMRVYETVLHGVGSRPLAIA
jgi:glycosyltransferase involved in cell wall biosynthesis